MKNIGNANNGVRALPTIYSLKTLSLGCNNKKGTYDWDDPKLLTK